jgi:hypothetical protein
MRKKTLTIVSIISVLFRIFIDISCKHKCHQKLDKYASIVRHESRTNGFVRILYIVAEKLLCALATLATKNFGRYILPNMWCSVSAPEGEGKVCKKSAGEKLDDNKLSEWDKNEQICMRNNEINVNYVIWITIIFCYNAQEDFFLCMCVCRQNGKK